MATLLGISAYQPPPRAGALDIEDDLVKEARERAGGNLSPLPVTKLRWYLADLEAAQAAADGGDLTSLGQLYRAMRRDGTFTGLLDTRTAGLVRLPRKLTGHPEAATKLRAQNGTRSEFDLLCPPSELALMDQDGIIAGVGVGELVPVPGRDFPILIRLEPEFLSYRWSEGRWYYRSISGLLPITPGDGRWVLHTPLGRMAPWQHGKWIACGQAFIDKSHAKLHRANYGGKLANPARVISAPIGATDDMRLSALRRLAMWGINSVFALPAGWQATLLESKGEGVEVWEQDEESAKFDYMMALAGQVVTSEGGKGFSNTDVHKSIRADLIQADGDELAHTVNTQILPAYVIEGWGEDALIEQSVSVEWDTKPPKDSASEAQTLTAASTAIESLSATLAPHGLELDVTELLTRFGVPTRPIKRAEDKPRLSLVEEDAA